MLIKWCATTFDTSYGEVITATMKEMAE
jgi:hypothetical protein